MRRPSAATFVFWLYATSWMVVASAAIASSDSPVHQLSIPSQPLDAALQEFAKQSGVQIVFLSQLTEGRQADAVEGAFNAADALNVMLARSPLTFRMLHPSTIEITLAGPAGRGPFAPAKKMPAADADGPFRRIPERSGPMEQVIIRATAEGVVAMRTETQLREIPQSVAVLSREQIRERNLVHLSDAMDRMVGITTVRTNTVDMAFLARGFDVTSFHVDGSANLLWFSRGEVRRPDLALFERIEVLRGADGLFSGNGQPGASINLVRKRPDPVPALEVSAWVGSWNNRRVVVDATGPLALDGALRGRLVGVYHDQDYFYEGATSDRKTIFGVMEYDVTPDTLLTVGGSYDWDDTIPVMRGFPLRWDGTDPRRPRKFALVTDWSYRRWDTRETYLQLRQAFTHDWTLKLGAALWKTGYSFADGHPGLDKGLVNTADPDFYALTYENRFSLRPYSRQQFATNITLTGGFSLLGMRTDIAFGTDYARWKAASAWDVYVAYSSRRIDAAELSASMFPDPRITGGPLLANRGESRGDSETLGTFFSARVHLTDAMTISAGARAGKDRWSSNSSGRPWSSVTMTPYAAAMYRVHENYSLYASYADIYRDVLADVFQPWGSAVRARPDGSDIGVRRGVNIEAGIKASWRDGAVNGMLAAYQVAQHNVPIALPRSVLPESATRGSVPGTSHSVGADLELSGTIQPRWQLGAGYSYNDNRRETGLWQGVRGPRWTATELSSRTPKHSLKAWTRVDLPGPMNRWALGGSVRAQTEQMQETGWCTAFSQRGMCTSRVTGKRFGGSYALLDIDAGYQVDSQWRVDLSVSNVFDKTYYESLGTVLEDNWYGEPRNFLMKVEASF